MRPATGSPFASNATRWTGFGILCAISVCCSPAEKTLLDVAPPDTSVPDVQLETDQREVFPLEDTQQEGLPPDSPCRNHDECQSSLCIPHVGQNICAAECVNGTCGRGFVCIPPSANSTKSLCHSLAPNLCLPCGASPECGSQLATSPARCVAIPRGDGAGIAAAFCGVPCTSYADCPQGYVCGESMSVEGEISHQCLLAAGMCTCTASALELDLKSVCSNSASGASCLGHRSCTPSGSLTECDARTAGPEVPDGEDNDCNGLIDDGLTSCGDGTCEGSENSVSCPVDCCGYCGDGKCANYKPNGKDGPTVCNEVCPVDCDALPCGNDKCEDGENPIVCPEDCQKFICSNGICEYGENNSNCYVDCGIACGNCTCESGESFDSCPADCGFCGDGYCISSCGVQEDVVTCFADCCVPQCSDDPCGEDGCGGFCSLCDDFHHCTDDLCDSDKQCINEIQDFWCVIDDICTPSGTTNPSNPCDACSPISSQVTWTSLDDFTPCGPGSVCWQGACCPRDVNCEGRVCGDDFCGGNCGTCPAGLQCSQGSCVECDDGNAVPWDGCTDGLIQEFQVNSTQGAGGRQRWPAVAALPDGGFSIVWQMWGLPWIKPGVLLRRFTPDGAAIGLDDMASPFGVDCGSPDEFTVSGPDVTTLSTGDMVVCWNDFDSSHAPQSTLFRGWSFPWASWETTQTPVAPEQTLRQYGGQIVALGNSDFVVVWTTETAQGATPGVYFRVFSATGSPLTEAIPIAPEAAAYKQWQPTVTAMGEAKFVVAWTQLVAADVGEIRMRMAYVDGSLAPETITVNSSPSSCRSPRTITLDNGFLAVAWMSLDPDGQGPLDGDGDGWGTFARVYNDSVAPFTQPFPLNAETSRNQGLPSLAPLPGTRFVAAWSSESPEGHTEVRARIMDSDGSPADTVVANPVSLYPALTEDTTWRYPSLASWADGTFIVVWETADQKVFAQRYNTDGTKKMR